MRLRDLERHLKSHGCHFEREGGNHTLLKGSVPHNSILISFLPTTETVGRGGSRSHAQMSGDPTPRHSTSSSFPFAASAPFQSSGNRLCAGAPIPPRSIRFSLIPHSTRARLWPPRFQFSRPRRDSSDDKALRDTRLSACGPRAETCLRPEFRQTDNMRLCGTDPFTTAHYLVGTGKLAGLLPGWALSVGGRVFQTLPLNAFADGANLGSLATLLSRDGANYLFLP